MKVNRDTRSKRCRKWRKSGDLNPSIINYFTVDIATPPPISKKPISLEGSLLRFIF
jgi:hypothetical protein